MIFEQKLDIILKESELINAEDEPQYLYDLDNGFYRKVYNSDSNNSQIISYAMMMKIILGEENTYRTLHEDTSVAFEYFDQFKDISDETLNNSVYYGKSPMLNVVDYLDKIKETNSLELSLELDRFFTECLQRKVVNELNSPTLTEEGLERISNDIYEFEEQMAVNPEIKTKQDTIIENLKKMVELKEKEFDYQFEKEESVEKEEPTEEETYETYSHPRFEELNELERLKFIAEKNNDEVGYNYAEENIKRIIMETPATVTQEEWNEMKTETKISFVKIKMREAKILRDPKAFFYWKNMLEKLENNKEVTEEYSFPSSDSLFQSNDEPEEALENIEKQVEVAEEYQDDYQKNNQNEREKSKSTDVSNSINNIKEELTRLQIQYQAMLSDGYIDEDELFILLYRMKNLDEDAKKLKNQVSGTPSEIIADSIISTIAESREQITNKHTVVEETEKGMSR